MKVRKGDAQADICLRVSFFAWKLEEISGIGEGKNLPTTSGMKEI